MSNFTDYPSASDWLNDLSVIDPAKYHVSAEARALAHRVAAAGDLEVTDMFEIVDEGDHYRCGLYVADADGKWLVEDDELVTRWVEVTLP